MEDTGHLISDLAGEGLDAKSKSPTEHVKNTFPVEFPYEDPKVSGLEHNIVLNAFPLNNDPDWIQVDINKNKRRKIRKDKVDNLGRLVFKTRMEESNGEPCLDLMGNYNYSNVTGVVGKAVTEVVIRTGLTIYVHGINPAAEKMYERIKESPPDGI